MKQNRNAQLKFGYFAAHEQYEPVTLLQFAVHASELGFDSIWSSDHFQPWFHTGGQAGFAWTWLAALGERTRRTLFGTGVTSPLRYNPAVIAQAFATLAVMYQDRVFLTLGTGEALNDETVTATWPKFHARVEMVEESIHIMRKLWTSNDPVSFCGKHFKVRNARLYTRPERTVPLYVASNGPTMARVAGKLADGYLTLPLGHGHIQDVLLPEVDRGAKEAGRNPDEIEKVIEIEMSFDADYDRALESCWRWAGCLTKGSANKTDPKQIEEDGRRLITREKLAQTFLIATKPDDIIRATEPYLKMGFKHIQYLSSSPDENQFIETMTSKVLPYLRSNWG
jgi:coenzyme F420-dependent glucose-6-phosphate dehydrogenase